MRVSTVDVMRVAKQIQDEFTTADIAEAMEKPEYSIRVALAWLVRRGLVEQCGKRNLRTKRCNQNYFANMYRAKKDVTAVDFNTLMQTFCCQSSGDERSEVLLER